MNKTVYIDLRYKQDSNIWLLAWLCKTIEWKKA